ncbi:PSP1 C-terminal domain protein [Paenibacillus sp. HGF7]|nr:PSP1 C-terminal domain protein [Paenibacillus sp. HGF7]
MYSVVGVRFKKAGKVYYFDPIDLPVEQENAVIVETARGIEYGRVVIGKKTVQENDVVLPLKKVIRIANPTDAQLVEENKKAAKDAFGICLNKIKDHQLKMKLVDVEYTFDRNKIIFILRLREGLTSGSWLRTWRAFSERVSNSVRSGYGMKPKCWAVSDRAAESYAVLHSWGISNRYRSRWPRTRTCP